MYYYTFCGLILNLLLIPICPTNSLKFNSSTIGTRMQLSQPSLDFCNITCPMCTHSCVHSCENQLKQCIVEMPDGSQEPVCFKGCFKHCPKYTNSLRFVDIASDDPCQPCIGNPCQNNGVCVNISNDTRRDEKYECKCSEPFFGRHCERWGNGRNQ